MPRDQGTKTFRRPCLWCVGGRYGWIDTSGSATSVRVVDPGAIAKRRDLVCPPFWSKSDCTKKAGVRWRCLQYGVVGRVMSKPGRAMPRLAYPIIRLVAPLSTSGEDPVDDVLRYLTSEFVLNSGS